VGDFLTPPRPNREGESEVMGLFRAGANQNLQAHSGMQMEC